jgi:phosphopantothenoylcysteine decarboxylase/phosphopantothenate--cysteine ligase
LEAVLKELRQSKPDFLFAAGAPTDYKPTTVSPKKIKTRDKPRMDLQLEASPKIIDAVRKASPKSFIVAFKTEHGVSDEELVDEAYKILHEKNADLVAANDVARQGVGFQTDTNELFVVDGRKQVVHIPLAEKRAVARQLVDIAVKKLKE